MIFIRTAPGKQNLQRSQAEIDATRTTLGVHIAREVMFKAPGVSATAP